MKSLIPGFVTVLIFSVLAGSVSAATYYVDQGNTSGPCSDAYTTGENSLSQPWCTIAIANNLHVAGDHVYILPGQYREGIRPKAGINENQHTVYSGYGDRTQIELLGSDNITGWTQCSGGNPICTGVSNNVWYKSFNSPFRRIQLYDLNGGPPECTPYAGGPPSHYVCYGPGGYGTAHEFNCWQDRQYWLVPANLNDAGYLFLASRNQTNIDIPGEYYYDYDYSNPPNSVLYLRAYNDVDPNTHTIECTQRNTEENPDTDCLEAIPSFINSYTTIQNLTIMHFHSGIQICEHHILIQNNELAFNTGTGTYANNPGAIFHPHVASAGIQIINNLIHDSGNDRGAAIAPNNQDSNHAGDGIRVYGLSDSIIENNTVYNVSMGIDLKADNTNVTIKGNKIIDAVYSSIRFACEATNNKIIENLIYNTDDSYGVIHIGAFSSNIFISQNTIWNTLGHGVRMIPGECMNNGGPISGTIIKNNIILSNAEEIHIERGDTTDSNYNLYDNTLGAPSFHWFGANLNFAGWNSATGLDANSLVDDPSFVNPSANDFYLQEGSPAIDAGELIPGYHCPVNDETDPNQFNCRHWSGVAPDIGYYEYVSGSPIQCANVNGDSVVNIIDLVLVIFHQGRNSGQGDWTDYQHLDINTDGSINFDDVSSVISSFGQNC